MTAMDLQAELAREIERILKDIRCRDRKGNLAEIRAYEQGLPKRMQNVEGNDEIMPEEMPEEELFPYCVVRIDSGEIQITGEMQQVKTVLVFGIFDDDMDCRGYKVIMTMIQRITDRFSRDPILNGRYRVNRDAGISWILDEEDRYPFYFGALEMSWDTIFVRREDRYA